MATFRLTPKQKLFAIIGISFCFFIAELIVAFSTKSLALLADAFHYMNDLIGFVVALAAIIISERASSPDNFSFGWARAQLLGAFFNGVFLLALGVSIFLQSIERFIRVEHVENPKLVLIMGCVGLALNIISATLLHEHHGHDHGGHSHSHSPIEDDEHTESHKHDHNHNHDNVEIGRQSVEGSGGNDRDGISLMPVSAHAEHRHTIVDLQGSGRDLGIMGVLFHVIGDACNNVGVIIAALIIWLTTPEARFYADPGISMTIAIMILVTSIPLVKNSGKILMQSAPKGVNIDDVKHDLEKIPGIQSVHELHIWRLDQRKAIATAHMVVSNNDMVDFMNRARTVSECLHAYGIHSATLQPELATPALPSFTNDGNTSHNNITIPTEISAATTAGTDSSSGASIRRRRPDISAPCQIVCGNICESLTCCNTSTMRI
ncbi:putative cation diffusion facilitator family metal ion transporter [Daldinia caldariorum]|uniref:putative cation diffusion facilitator family metal ion transporter n=1 Tax=Daldinia caldariorum TaxID=326644 RepID=UPI0020080AA3|nr:putative cation diffusion facilitator family metal ion transporter [Daldinia caldariorum]KAI1470574.1 putative cation diffusion facilitator family metal ion transporter [Daldinia caldariorum]